MKADYYEILGVSPTATQDEIQNARRKLAKQYHPDKNPGNPAAEKKYAALDEAYQVLKDPKKRTDYDRSRGRSKQTVAPAEVEDAPTDPFQLPPNYFNDLLELDDDSFHLERQRLLADYPHLESLLAGC